jgi:hypothetical protein
MELCLTAIVKNEAPVISRMLRSVRPFISSYSISDTGSTDNTMDIIRDELRDIPGVLIQDEWIDFATNRNIALSRATGAYTITIDADEILWRTGDTGIPDADSIALRVNSPGVQFWVPRIMKNDRKWQWMGVVHEIPEHETPCVDALWDGFQIESKSDGNQTVSGGKLEKHLLVLENAERTPRNIFYHARTLYDLKRYEECIPVFEEHVVSGAWDEEIYISLYQIAFATKELSRDALPGFLRAYEFRPSRGEALYEACKLMPKEQAQKYILDFKPGYIDTLFIDPRIEYKLHKLI